MSAIAVHKTDLFRDEPQLAAFVDHVLGPLVRRQQPLRLWSAGCATGEEVATLLVLLSEAGAHSGSTVLGTDISESALQQARSWTFSEEVFKRVPPVLRTRYFQPKGRSGEQVLLPELAGRAQFERHNLMDLPYPDSAEGGFDVIFCRNVLIYFTEDAFDRTVRALAGRLKPGGTLVLSATEPILRPVAELATIRARDAFFYQRVDPAVPPKRVAPAAPPLSRPVPPAMVLRSAPIPAPAPSLASGPVVPRTDPRDEADEQFQLVLGWAAAGEPDTATEQGLRRALYLDPHLAQARFLLAMLLEQRGGRADAATEYRRALAALQEGKARATQFFLNNERLKGACEAALARLGFLRR